MWDSPYQACRSFTDNTGAAATGAAAVVAGAAVFRSAMTGSKIGFLHALVLGQVGVMTFGKHAPAGEYSDDVGKIGDDAQIMFDHQNGILRRNALDKRGALIDVLMPHAGHRLVEQHHLRIECKRGCDFERTLASV